MLPIGEAVGFFCTSLVDSLTVRSDAIQQQKSITSSRSSFAFDNECNSGHFYVKLQTPK
jgi:hypothetical protein